MNIYKSINHKKLYELKINSYDQNIKIKYNKYKNKIVLNYIFKTEN